MNLGERATGDLFLKLETARQGPVKGESQDSKHAGEIDLIAKGVTRQGGPLDSLVIANDGMVGSSRGAAPLAGMTMAIETTDARTIGRQSVE